MKVHGGRRYYGQAIGIACLDQKDPQPCIPGNVANASTYDFPVRLVNIPGLHDNPFPPVCDAAGNYTPEVQRTVDAVQELERDGVRAVVMSCGFFSLLQPVLTREVAVPVFTSPLLLIPLIARMIAPDRKVGVVTASRQRLTADYLEPVGVTPTAPIEICGLEPSTEFYACFMGGTRTVLDVTCLRDEVVTIVRDFVAGHPAIGALLLECSDLPPFAADIQAAVNLPVFDYIGFVRLIYQSVVQRPYTGFL